jgi:enoyl-CoA hydratase
VKNAVDGPTASALEQAFADFESDESARVAVFCGADDVFCSGADLKAMASPELRDRVDPHGAGPMGPSRMTLEKPVIAAIEGYAVAGGLELALWSDKRVVSKKVKLVQQQKH